MRSQPGEHYVVEEPAASSIARAQGRGGQGASLSDYEKKRAAQIADNEAELEKLGLLRKRPADNCALAQPPKPKKAKKPTNLQLPPAAPSRSSERLSTQPCLTNKYNEQQEKD